MKCIIKAYCNNKTKINLALRKNEYGIYCLDNNTLCGVRLNTNNDAPDNNIYYAFYEFMSGKLITAQTFIFSDQINAADLISQNSAFLKCIKESYNLDF
jgi:hypothetical protein